MFSWLSRFHGVDMQQGGRAVTHAGDDLPRDLDPYFEGRVVPLDASAVERAAHTMANVEGDGRQYDEDPEFRKMCVEHVQMVVSLYLERRHG
jgi:hypothetical protein